MDLFKSTVITLSIVGLTVSAHAAAVVRSSAGANPAAIQATVEQFRTDISLGGANNGNGGTFATGRREINWDGGANSAITTALAPNAFNGNPAARGAQMSTPGTGFIQSARIPGDDANPALRFGDINPQYNTIFKVFSNQKLVAASGSTITDVGFFLPASPTTPASVNGFGAVFADVDALGATRLEFFGAGDVSLGSYPVPVANDGLSFLGVFFDAGERITRVRIFAGDTALAAAALDDPSHDVVAIDDFIYGEPTPAPGSLAAFGLGGVLASRRRRA